LEEKSPLQTGSTLSHEYVDLMRGLRASGVTFRADVDAVYPKNLVAFDF
jgi:hypothetical protein